MVSCGISTSFPVLFPSEGKVAHALLTRPPLEYSGASSLVSPLDLHVLSTPPAFVLSQDQTLSFNPVYTSPGFSTRQSSTHSELLSFLCVILSVSFSRFSAACAKAPCDLYILSKSQRNVNRFFKLFFTFGRSFQNVEHSAKILFPSFRFWARYPPLSPTRTFVVTNLPQPLL